ncbi:MAG: adenylyltransferase/cytidyltransferase family protein [Sedimentisphaerales bacterium]|nr:adenylyltransferase/cytidyltransferase family protein [Sedimentisphaerales bacterium]
MKNTTVYIMGCWDLLHVGHLSILERAKALGDKLIVGVFSDDVIASPEYKGRGPVIPCEERARMVEALKCVDVVFVLEEREYLAPLKKYDPDILAIGEDWGKHRRNTEAVAYMEAKGGKVVQLPYTKGVSSTAIKEKAGRSI